MLALRFNSAKAPTLKFPNKWGNFYLDYVKVLRGCYWVSENTKIMIRDVVCGFHFAISDFYKMNIRSKSAGAL
jgi:hypothetical protein